MPKSKKIHYRKYGGCFQLAKPVSFYTGFRPKDTVKSESGRLTLYPDGRLDISEGYVWDGVSGGPNKKSWLKASLLHDALYQLMRERQIPHATWRRADMEYGAKLKKDGAWQATISMQLWILKKTGGKHARPSKRKKIHSAP